MRDVPVLRHMTPRASVVTHEPQSHGVLWHARKHGESSVCASLVLAMQGHVRMDLTGMPKPCRSLYDFHGPASEAAQWSVRQAERGGLAADAELLEPPEPQPRVRRALPCALLHAPGVVCMPVLLQLKRQSMLPPRLHFVSFICASLHCPLSCAMRVCNYFLHATVVCVGTAREAGRPRDHLRLRGRLCELCGAGAPECCACPLKPCRCIQLPGKTQACTAEPFSNLVESTSLTLVATWSACLTAFAATDEFAAWLGGTDT